MGVNSKDYIISESTSVLDAMRVITRGENSVAFVCDNMKLLAAVSDGDVRRFLINGGDLSDKITKVANYHPYYARGDEDVDYNAFMRAKGITALPVLDSMGCITEIKFQGKASYKKSNIGIPVVIMAGGKGKRLKPYTDILPKPLIPIGSMTITEHIMERFKEYGCDSFDMIVNYKREFIKSYFAENETIYDVNFIEEPDFWGTAGGLKLAEGLHEGTVFITNCDILVEADYGEIYDYHKRSGNVLTLVCASKKVVIPYGTVETDDEMQIVSLTEKPSYEFKTNTGLYLAEPEFFAMIPKDTKIDITDMIQMCLNKGIRVGTYLIDEDDWLDMGQMEELERMKKRLNVE